MKKAATPISATAAAASFSWRVTPSVLEHEASREGREHEEKYVEVDQESHRLIVAASAHLDLHRGAAGDDERDPQRQGQQRQEQLAGADPRHHRGEQAPEQ